MARTKFHHLDGVGENVRRQFTLEVPLSAVGAQPLSRRRAFAAQAGKLQANSVPNQARWARGPGRGQDEMSEA